MSQTSVAETAFSLRVNRHDGVPDDIVSNPSLNSAIARLLPENYNFEVHKTIWRIREVGARRVALQFPEGLLMCACALSDIFERFCSVDVFILGDVTYGACCIDDFTAERLGVDIIIHYGHSCLVPVYLCRVKILYVFVEMRLDLPHLVETLKSNFDAARRIALVSTIQFAPSLRVRFVPLSHPLFSKRAKRQLDEYFTKPVLVPRSRPLSQGEILGCTSPPNLGSEVDALVYVGDGRFHIESAMMHNPRLSGSFFEYNPYTKCISQESFDQVKMLSLRREAVRSAREASCVGLIVSTLGRQTNMHLCESMERILRSRGIEFIRILLSEIYPAKLALLENDVGAWVQLACPRLSIDWGSSFSKPILNAYEAFVAFGDDVDAETSIDGDESSVVPYPMDNYSRSANPTYANSYFVKRQEEEEEN